MKKLENAENKLLLFEYTIVIHMLRRICQQVCKSQLLKRFLFLHRADFRCNFYTDEADSYNLCKYLNIDLQYNHSSNEDIAYPQIITAGTISLALRLIQSLRLQNFGSPRRRQPSTSGDVPRSSGGAHQRQDQTSVQKSNSPESRVQRQGGCGAQ